LAEKQPDAYTADWAESLSNLGILLGDVGRFEEALQNAEQAERLRRNLAEKQPDAHTAAWAMSLGNLADAQLAAKRFVAALETTKRATSKVGSLAERYPLIYNPWLGFSHRVAAESQLELGMLDDAVADARRSTEIWAEIATLRQSFESNQVAKAFRALIKCQLKLEQNEAASASLGRVFDLLRKPLHDNPKPLRQALLESIDLIVAVDRDAIGRVVPSELLAIVRAGS
jgi:tetratricopeptide (TPR) repeat protein